MFERIPLNFYIAVWSIMINYRVWYCKIAKNQTIKTHLKKEKYPIKIRLQKKSKHNLNKSEKYRVCFPPCKYLNDDTVISSSCDFHFVFNLAFMFLMEVLYWMWSQNIIIHIRAVLCEPTVRVTQGFVNGGGETYNPSKALCSKQNFPKIWKHDNAFCKVKFKHTKTFFQNKNWNRLNYFEIDCKSVT